VEKFIPKFSAISEIFEKLPNENNRPMGENSPNLATLLPTQSTSARARLDRFALPTP
jgi:hypothetical protein